MSFLILLLTWLYHLLIYWQSTTSTAPTATISPPPTFQENIHLQVPYRSQSEATEANDCGETVLAMLFQYHTDQKVNIDQLNQIIPGSHRRSLQELRQIDDQLGHDFSYWNNFNPQIIKNWLQTEQTPLGAYIEISPNLDHWIVITGINSAQDNWIFTYHDPLTGPNQTMTLEEFQQRTPKGFWAITY